MQTQISAIYLTPKGPQEITLFGYDSKSIPGIEIVGLKHFGKIIKEKFIFLSRSRNLKIPLKKYTLCCESFPQDIDVINYVWLEFPLLLLYWSLSEQIKIKSLDQCYASGSITPQGEIQILNFDSKFKNSKKISINIPENLSDANSTDQPNSLIDARELLQHIPQIKFCSFSAPIMPS
ncbi:MAG: hypothetical protein U0T83_06610 [Bacteriovoracaceae bacterium]